MLGYFSVLEVLNTTPTIEVWKAPMYSECLPVPHHFLSTTASMMFRAFFFSKIKNIKLFQIEKMPNDNEEAPQK